MRMAMLTAALMMATTLGGPGAARAATPAAKPPAVDPEAMAALDKMGGFLRAQKTFSVDTESTTDLVLDSGQKVKRTSIAHLKVERPDKLRADIDSDEKTQQIFYDGKTFTIFQPQVGFYADFAAPPTLAEMADVAEKRYGIDLPLADLFYWGSDKSHAAHVTSAINLGPTVIKGVSCDHFAFRQPDVDWQIWIQRGDRPLPAKLVVTTVGVKAEPEHEVVMTWNLDARIDAHAFAFVPPPGAHKIQFEALAPLSPAVPRHGNRPSPTRTDRPTKGATP
jgi:hypothetical protein